MHGSNHCDVTAYDHTIERLFEDGRGRKKRDSIEKVCKNCRKNRIIKLSTYIQLKKVVNYYN